MSTGNKRGAISVGNYFRESNRHINTTKELIREATEELYPTQVAQGYRGVYNITASRRAEK
jgi:hypothetical protein